jgi:WD40 repeat protein
LVTKVFLATITKGKFVKTKIGNLSASFILLSLIISACSPASQGQAAGGENTASAASSEEVTVQETATDEPATTQTAEPANLVIGLETLGQLRLFWSTEFIGDPDAEYGCEWALPEPCTYESSITDYAFSADSDTLAVGVCLGVRTVDRSKQNVDIWGCTGENAIILYDSASGEELRRLTPAALPLSLAFHPDGTILAAGLVNSDIEVWDLTSSELITTLPGIEKHTGAFPLAFVLDGSQLLTGSGPGQVTISATSGRSLVGGSISVWNWQSAEILQTITGVHGIRITPDGDSFVTHTVNNPDGISSDTVRIYDLKDLDVFSEFLPEGQVQPGNVYINPRNGWIATVESNESGFNANLANFWDPQGFELVDSFAWDEGFEERGFLYDLNSGGFTADGYFLLTQDGPTNEFQTDENGVELEECGFALADVEVNQIYFVSHPMTYEECMATYVVSGTKTLVISADGKFIAGEAGDGVLKLWGIDADLPTVEPACHWDC